MPVMEGFTFMEDPEFGSNLCLALIQSLICLHIEWVTALTQIMLIAILICDGMQLVINILMLINLLIG